MVDHDYAMTDTGLAVLAAIEALEEMAAYDAAPIDLYPTDVHDDADAHGS